MKIKQITLYVLACAVLVGCDSRIDAVNQEMANIRNQRACKLFCVSSIFYK